MPDFSPSGGGTSGIATWCSQPSSTAWNDTIIEKIGTLFWIACTRRVVKLPPSRMRSTS